MNKQSRNYIKRAVSQFKHRSSISSSTDYFKTDNRSITTLFESEAKCL